jgi:hypothetical protein
MEVTCSSDISVDFQWTRQIISQERGLFIHSIIRISNLEYMSNTIQVIYSKTNKQFNIVNYVESSGSVLDMEYDLREL